LRMSLSTALRQKSLKRKVRRAKTTPMLILHLTIRIQMTQRQKRRLLLTNKQHQLGLRSVDWEEVLEVFGIMLPVLQVLPQLHSRQSRRMLRRFLNNIKRICKSNKNRKKSRKKTKTN